MCVSASRCRGEPLCLSGPSFGMWISIFFLKTHLDRRRATAGARAKPAKPGRRVLRRGGPLRRPSLRRHHAHQIRPSCSLKLREQHFIRRVASATRFVGATCMLVAVRHVERRRIITEPECRRAWLPNRPAARVRTDAPWCDRHTPCWCGRRSNAFDCCGDVGPAQGRERHGIRKPRDGLPARRTRRTWRAAGSDRRWACRQVETVRLSDDGILRDAHPPADLCCRVPLRPELPQLADRVVRPFEFGVRAAHQGLLLLLFHRNPASRPAGGAPGKGARAPGRTLARRACRQAPSSAVVRGRVIRDVARWGGD